MTYPALRHKVSWQREAVLALIAAAVYRMQFMGATTFT